MTLRLTVFPLLILRTLIIYSTWKKRSATKGFYSYLRSKVLVIAVMITYYLILFLILLIFSENYTSYYTAFDIYKKENQNYYIAFNFTFIHILEIILLSIAFALNVNFPVEFNIKQELIVLFFVNWSLNWWYES